jgi:hypothetical protein
MESRDLSLPSEELSTTRPHTEGTSQLSVGFRRLQRLWRIGKYFSFGRSLLLQSLQGNNKRIAD